MDQNEKDNRGRNVAIGVGAAAAVSAGLALYSQFAARQAEAAVPPDGEFIEVAGARLHYVDRGQGPTIVMVHGLGGQLRNFSYSLLDRLTNDHRVILVDRPRSGYSVATSGTEPGVAAQGEIVARFIRRLGLDRPLIVGHSLGGAVALSLALDHPDLISGLALIAPLTQPQSSVPAVFRGLAVGSKLPRGLFSHVLGAPLETLAGGATSRAVFAPEPVPDDFPVNGGGALALRPGNLDAASFEIGVASDEAASLTQRYGGMAMPVGILFGRDDHVLDPGLDGKKTVGMIPGATLELIDGGHMIPLTRPDETAAFIRAVEGRTGG